MRRRVGSLLLVLGVVGVLLGGLTLSEPREWGRVGPVRITVQEHRTRLIPGWFSGLLIVAGVGLLMAGRRGGSALPPAGGPGALPGGVGDHRAPGGRAPVALDARRDGPGAEGGR